MGTLFLVLGLQDEKEQSIKIAKRYFSSFMLRS